MKIRLHFNRINMQRGLPGVWSAHTYKACNSSRSVEIVHNKRVVGRTVFNPNASQPRAFIELIGKVVTRKDGTSRIILA